MSDHDAHLAGYRTYNADVWCENKECPFHFEAVEVLVEVEYGQHSPSPEECPACHSAWLWDAPEEEEGEE